VRDVTKGPSAPTTAILSDEGRRCPGRVATVNPQLLPLLRDQAAHETVPENEIPAASHLPEQRYHRIVDRMPGRGIVFGVLLAIPAWTFLALIVWWFLR
jgi:hypothetical protein